MKSNILLRSVFYGYSEAKKKITIENNKSFHSILKCLVQEGFILKFYIIKNSNKLVVWLKYEKGVPALKVLKILSKKSKPKFVSFKSLNTLLTPRVLILSTTEGVFTSKQAKKND